jgi:tripartite-type tricarboxylate transporter receptor subunit TctC
VKHVSFLMTLAILSLATSGVRAADAAANYPNRPIRFIAPFVAGGPSDLMARLLGQKLSEAWGQPVVVDNRGSAAGIVGFDVLYETVTASNHAFFLSILAMF